MKHVMIDLESMGIAPSSAIVSIGAVIFDPGRGLLSKDTFYVALDWKNQRRETDRSTVEWWKGRSAKARKELQGVDPLKQTLDDLAFWLPNDCKVWGNGATFDISMLEDAYRQHSISIPWEFWNIRDMRTIKDIYESSRGGLSVKNSGVSHHALEDAIFQAREVIMMWRKIMNPRG